MVICLDLVADLHMAQLMPLPLTVFCFSKIQIGFTFLVPAYPGSPGQTAVKRVCVRNETDDYQLLFIVSISLLCKILNACQNKIHGIVAYTFLNIYEKIHQFSSSIKSCTQKIGSFSLPHNVVCLYIQTRFGGYHWDLIMSIHLGRVSTYPCFIFAIMSKPDQTNDIHLSRLSS